MLTEKELEEIDAYAKRISHLAATAPPGAVQKTSDEFYTPPAVYAAVLDWLYEEGLVSRAARIVRPFFPGGDYEAFDYREGDVVVDNPPFSIGVKITRHYLERGIDFFLFAPGKTVCGYVSTGCTVVVVNADVAYVGGLKLNTAFVTNLTPHLCVLGSPSLRAKIAAAQGRPAGFSSVGLTRHFYPPEVFNFSKLDTLARRGIPFSIPAREACFIRELDVQRGARMSIYGGGLLVSRRVAEKYREEMEAWARRSSADILPDGSVGWRLSAREEGIVDELDRAAAAAPAEGLEPSGATAAPRPAHA